MNLSMTRLVTVSAIVAAFSLGATQASAQKATFNLPVEARWGNAVLSPGNYTLTSPDSVSDIRIFYLHGDSGTQMAVPAIVNNDSARGKNYLKLVNVDGTYYVQQYVSATTGRSFKFAVPKAREHELRAQDRVIVTGAL